MTPRIRRSLGVLVLAIVPALSFGCRASDHVTGAHVVDVFAASSTEPALAPLFEQLEASLGVRVRASYGASSSGARLIETDRRADLFVSADPDWMAYLASRALLAVDTRRDLATNRLVLAAPAGEAVLPSVEAAIDMLVETGGRLVLGDPDHVPLGRYGRQALRSLGRWDDVSDRVLGAQSARAALALLELGEAPLGIIYATDAAGSDRVRVVGEVDSKHHDPIRYEIALVEPGNDDARQVWQALLDARGELTEAGFGPPYSPHGDP